jgi:hypothetical protein
MCLPFDAIIYLHNVSGHRAILKLLTLSDFVAGNGVRRDGLGLAGDVSVKVKGIRFAGSAFENHTKAIGKVLRLDRTPSSEAPVACSTSARGSVEGYTCKTWATFNITSSGNPYEKQYAAEQALQASHLFTYMEAG